MSNSPKSLETILDEERRDVLALLEKRPDLRSTAAEDSKDPERTVSPLANSQPPVRSMLDIGQASGTVHSSMIGTSTGSISVPPVAPIRSMLDVDGTPSAMIPSVKSDGIPRVERATTADTLRHRSLSDTACHPAGMGPRATNFGPASAYRFSGHLPSNPGGPTFPKRNSQAGKNVSTSNSPRSSLIETDRSKLVLADGSVLDMNSAYHRLSDTNLDLLGNRLSTLFGKSQRRASSGDAIGAGRAMVEKDCVPLEGEDDVMESSEEEDRSSDEERQRGRNKGARYTDGYGTNTLDTGRSNWPRSALGRAAAAGEDGLANTAKKNEKYKVRCLLEPEITVTGPPGDKLKSYKPGIHPYTSFDEGASGFNTPVDSDAEADFTDIKRAQKLSVNMTSIVSTPATSRCVRTIYRGDFAKMQQEAHDNQRRVRKYLVATDLSEEAAHALEWTIGTVLRDGDTLLAIYCVDEELGIAPNEPAGDDSQLHAQAAAIAATTKSGNPIPVLPSVLVVNPLAAAFKLETNSASASPMGRGRAKAEQERYRAVQDITDRVSKLLRKTRLQVKVVIEVIHCKSPKHLITEVIDYLSPTLVILGSRGRSALKGVILGSFSNYLVTKSSVPVMVARKRLRKHSKYKRPAIRLANNLAANPAVRSLATARID